MAPKRKKAKDPKDAADEPETNEPGQKGKPKGRSQQKAPEPIVDPQDQLDFDSDAPFVALKELPEPTTEVIPFKPQDVEGQTIWTQHGQSKTGLHCGVVGKMVQRKKDGEAYKFYIHYRDGTKPTRDLTSVGRIVWANNIVTGKGCTWPEHEPIPVEVKQPKPKKEATAPVRQLSRRGSRMDSTEIPEVVEGDEGGKQPKEAIPEIAEEPPQSEVVVAEQQQQPMDLDAAAAGGSPGGDGEDEDLDIQTIEPEDQPKQQEVVAPPPPLAVEKAAKDEQAKGAPAADAMDIDVAEKAPAVEKKEAAVVEEEAQKQPPTEAAAAIEKEKPLQQEEQKKQPEEAAAEVIELEEESPVATSPPPSAAAVAPSKDQQQPVVKGAKKKAPAKGKKEAATREAVSPRQTAVAVGKQQQAEKRKQPGDVAVEDKAGGGKKARFETLKALEQKKKEAAEAKGKKDSEAAAPVVAEQPTSQQQQKGQEDDNSPEAKYRKLQERFSTANNKYSQALKTLKQAAAELNTVIDEIGAVPVKKLDDLAPFNAVSLPKQFNSAAKGYSTNAPILQAVDDSYLYPMPKLCQVLNRWLKMANKNPVTLPPQWLGKTGTAAGGGAKDSSRPTAKGPGGAGPSNPQQRRTSNIGGSQQSQQAGNVFSILEPVPAPGAGGGTSTAAAATAGGPSKQQSQQQEPPPVLVAPVVIPKKEPEVKKYTDVIPDMGCEERTDAVRVLASALMVPVTPVNAAVELENVLHARYNQTAEQGKVTTEYLDILRKVWQHISPKSSTCRPSIRFMLLMGILRPGELAIITPELLKAKEAEVLEVFQNPPKGWMTAALEKIHLPQAGGKTTADPVMPRALNEQEMRAKAQDVADKLAQTHRLSGQQQPGVNPPLPQEPPPGFNPPLPPGAPGGGPSRPPLPQQQQPPRGFQGTGGPSFQQPPPPRPMVSLAPTPPPGGGYGGPPPSQHQHQHQQRPTHGGGPYHHQHHHHPPSHPSGPRGGDGGGRGSYPPHHHHEYDRRDDYDRHRPPYPPRQEYRGDDRGEYRPRERDMGRRPSDDMDLSG